MSLFLRSTSLRLAILLAASHLVTPPLAHADDPAQKLLAHAASLALATQTLQADILLTRQSANQPELRATGSITLMKPNNALVHLTGNDPAVPRLIASDGVHLFNFVDDTTYTEDSIDARGASLNEPWWNLPLRFFFTQSVAVFGTTPDPTATSTLLPDETINGQTFHVISIRGEKPFAYTEKLYLTAQFVLERAIVSFGDGPKPRTIFRCELSNVRLNQPLQPAAFHFVPPPQARLKQHDLNAGMLALGSAAPPFRLPSLNGTTVSLADQRHGAKATLVNFWYLNCPPCRLENPEFEKIYQQFHAQGFNILAIDKGDPPAAITTYARHAGLTYPILLGGEETSQSVFARYRISTFPGTYLLNADGRIVYRATGEDIAGLRQALAKLGFK
jgi:peroxiredoxin/outer membrane lipoprotein-sorting protein